jgi:hypothetical protein
VLFGISNFGQHLLFISDYNGKRIFSLEFWTMKTVVFWKFSIFNVKREE